MLDELTATGEVLWAGHGGLPGSDGWVSLHLADTAPLTLPDPGELEMSDQHETVLEALTGGGAYFFRQLATTLETSDHKALSAALWDLAWSGRVGNDTLGPVRALTRGGRSAHQVKRAPARVRGARPRLSGAASVRPHPTWRGAGSCCPSARPIRPSEPMLRPRACWRDTAWSRAGPWSVSAPRAASRRPTACSRPSRSPGAADAAISSRVSARPSSVRREPSTGCVPIWATSYRPEKPTALALAATDPANPFGAALPWPPQESGHRPGRKAGAIVALVDGALTLYVERGGKTLLTFTEDEDLLAHGIEALGRVVREGALGRLTVEKADGADILGQDSEVIRRAMESAGFVATPRGLRLRGAGACPRATPSTRRPSGWTRH